jgi:hypothetical protein
MNKGTPPVARYTAALRQEICARNLAFAREYHLAHALSYGEAPAVCYEPEGETHGNFLPETYRAILANPQWARRLKKAHTARRSALPRNDRGFWSELDSCNSSDALLMNVFCCPGVFDDGRVLALLGVEADAAPEFGYQARVPLAGGKFDRTEADMRLGGLLVEAKLTESGFQTAAKSTVEAYRHFAEVFERQQLPRTKQRYLSYQLLRNVLAAHAGQCAFCVLYDGRRPDLQQAWFEVMRCVRPLHLRLRCKALTWQELAAVVPDRLQEFLEEKYGIEGIQ